MQNSKIKTIVEAALSEEIVCKEGESWDFDTSVTPKVLTIKNGEDDGYSNKYLLGRTFDVIAEGLFTEVPEDYIFLLDHNIRKKHSLALSTIEELRLKTKMSFRYPGITDYFEYGFSYDDNHIGEKVENGEKGYIRFLYDIRKIFFGKEKPSFLDNYSVIEKMFKMESTSEMIEFFNNNILGYYKTLIEENVKDDDEDEEVPESGEDMMDRMKKKSELVNFHNSDDGEETESTQEMELGGEVVHASYMEKFRIIYPLYKRLIKKIKPILEDNALDRYVGGFRSGKLNLKALPKVVLNEPNIFKRKILNTKKSYSFGILIDESGSMKGNKIEVAGLSSILLMEVFNEVEVEIEVMGFNDTIHHYKKSGERLTNKIREGMEEIFGQPQGKDGGNNNDGYALGYMGHQMFQNSSEGSYKTLIVISDGNPLESERELSNTEKRRTKKDSVSDFDLKEEVQTLSKHINIIGIGIESSAVKEYYQNHIEINDINSLPEKIITIISKTIKRG